MDKTIVQRLGGFVYSLSLKDVPSEVVEKAKTCLINGIGIGISCYDTESARIGREVIKGEEAGMSPQKAATIFCDGARASVTGAAFANSALFHGRAQEDTLGTTHAGTILIPAALALAERNGNSGREVLEAVLAGYEVAGTFDRNISGFTTPRGFRASPIFGILGCAATASRLLKLTEEQTVNALGFAASFAGGTIECFGAGTMEWRFQVGVASREGIMSALIAKNGGRSAPTAFEGKAGYLNALANTLQNSDKLGRELGKTWEILNVAFKPYPVCAFNQTPSTTTLALVKEKDIDYKKIESIDVRLRPYEANMPGMKYKGPFSTVGATLMSTPFVVALACIERDVTFAGILQFGEPRILELLQRVNVIDDGSMPPYSTIIEITMRDGALHRKEMKVGPDYYNFDMERDIELVKKVSSETGVSQDKVDRIISLLRDINKLPSVKELVGVLASCP